MKICQVTSLHKRYDIRIFKKYAVSNAKAGHESFLICADTFDDEIKDGVSIHSVKKTFNNRLSRFLFLRKALLNLALKVDADIYQLHDPDLLFLAKRLKKRKKIVVFDSHEDYSTCIATKEWIPFVLRKPAQIIYNAIQRKTLSIIDGAIGVNDTITDKLKKHNEHTITINNYPLLFNEPAHNNNDSLCFAGVLSKDYKHDVIVDLLNKHGGAIKYNLAGDPRSPFFEDVMKKEGFRYVNFKNVISNEEVLQMYSESAVGLVISDYIANFNYKQGSLGVIKIFEYMMAGLPFIATDFDLWKPIIEDNEFGPTGICVDPNNVDEIEKAIMKLMKDRQLRLDYGKNGRKMAEKYYNWEILNTKMQRFYKELVSIQEGKK